MSPESRDGLANSIHKNPFIDFTKRTRKKHDTASNCACRLAFGHLVMKTGGSYKVRKLDHGLEFKSLQDASEPT